MKINGLKQRLRKERPMTTVTFRIPADVLEDLKRLAPMLGFSGYQPLMRAYIGQGLRADLERLEGSPELVRLLERLRALGVEDEIINQAYGETFRSAPSAPFYQPFRPESTRIAAGPGRVLAEAEAEYTVETQSAE
jgi:hypothetical protein